MRDYKKIKAFQFADELVIEVYKVSREFPREEIYGLTSQLRRAAVSAAANIAEGSSRPHRKDYLHFLSMAKGSLAEVEYLLSLVLRLGYLGENDFNKMSVLAESASKTLYGLIQFIKEEV